MQFTVENICGLIIRSRLFTPEEVKSLYQRWLDQAKDNVGNLSQFGKWLVSSQYLTEYQAALLLKGHADDFFLGQYRILDRLGKGRMAGVYRAIHHLGQIVAIKVLPPSKAKEGQLLGRFQRESRLAMRLKHPHVVRSFQVGETNGLHYLVMEYLEGETLDEVLARRKKLAPHEAVRLMHQALLGLQHIHEQGMVHRDLKPANLMLSPAPGRGAHDTTLHSTVKILDIGLGREMFDENTPPPRMQHPELTSEGTLLGTPDYLSPEQARDPRTIDIRADIYSLGCVLYHALTGQPPFPEKNILTQMIRHATETAKPLKEFNPAIPDGLQQMMNWMIAKQPDQRYPTPERAAQALQVFLVADSEAPRQDEPQEMRKYLTWLETGAKEEEPIVAEAVVAPPFALPASLPVAMPAAGIPVGLPPLPKSVQAAMAQPATAQPLAVAAPAGRSAPPPLSAAQRERRRAKRERHRGGAVVAAPAPPPAPAAPRTPEVDVELVPLNAVAGMPQRSGALTKRDWILLGVGAGAVILAGIIGMVIALILRS